MRVYLYASLYACQVISVLTDTLLLNYYLLTYLLTQRRGFSVNPRTGIDERSNQQLEVDL